MLCNRNVGLVGNINPTNSFGVANHFSLNLRAESEFERSSSTFFANVHLNNMTKDNVTKKDIFILFRTITSILVHVMYLTNGYRNCHTLSSPSIPNNLRYAPMLLYTTICSIFKNHCSIKWKDIIQSYFLCWPFEY